MDRLGSRSLSRRHRAIGRRGGPVLVTLATVAGLLASPARALGATPIDGGPITIFPVAINTSAGDQYDPHVDGDLVSYTSVDKIRFYDFFTSSDAQVASAPANQDLLSDVSN